MYRVTFRLGETAAVDATTTHLCEICRVKRVCKIAESVARVQGFLGSEWMWWTESCFYYSGLMEREK